MESTQKIIVGIDVSKATLDICLIDSSGQKHLVIDNKVKAIKSFLKTLMSLEQVIIGMENTGRFNWALYEVLANSPATTFVISPLHLKRSLGLVRGKNDKIDAERIALFTLKHYQEMNPWQPPRKQIDQLKVLLTERNYRIKVKRQLLKMKHDYKLMKKLSLDQPLNTMNIKLLTQVNQQIKQLEQQIELVIKSDEALSNQAKLIKSVPGIGKVTSWYLITKTNEFKTITNPRKLACYAGVVPFDHQSGTSIKWKQRVSDLADKKLKTVLHLGAMSAIRLDNDLRTYYLRKVKEGKNKMSVLNAVRNKIIHRVYATINKQKTYQKYLVAS